MILLQMNCAADPTSEGAELRERFNGVAIWVLSLGVFGIVVTAVGAIFNKLQYITMRSSEIILMCLKLSYACIVYTYSIYIYYISQYYDMLSHVHDHHVAAIFL